MLMIYPIIIPKNSSKSAEVINKMKLPRSVHEVIEEGRDDGDNDDDDDLTHHHLLELVEILEEYIQ